MPTIETDFSGRLPVEGYGPGFFRVAGMVYRGPLALLPNGPLPWEGLHDLSPFVRSAGEIDLVLVGIGPDVAALPEAARAALEGAGLGVEVMTTGPACRTYNVLLGEERRVAAALMPV
jgi:uncharacterized protein